MNNAVRHTNYDEVAATYDRRYAEDDYSGIERALIDFLGSPARHVLQVGCGTGHWLSVSEVKTTKRSASTCRPKCWRGREQS